MRIETYLGYEIVFPETNSWERDNAYIDLRDTGGNALGTVDVTLLNISVTDTVTLSYTTNLSYIRMNIREVVRNFMEAAREDGKHYVAYGIFVEVNGTSLLVGGRGVTCMQGQSLASRCHWSEDTILLHNGATKVMLAVPINLAYPTGGYTINGVRTPFGGSNWAQHISVGGSVDEIELDTVGTQSITITIDEASSLPEYGQSFVLEHDGTEVVGADGNTYIKYYYEYNGINQPAFLLKQSALYDVGDEVIWNTAVNPATLLGHITDIDETGIDVTRGELGYYGEVVKRWKVRLHRTCALEHEVVVEWFNADGLLRSASAQLLSDSLKTSGENVRRIDGELRSPSMRLITSTTQQVRLGFSNIPHGAYLEDILNSETVRLYLPNNSGFVEAIPTTQSLGKIDDSDVAIEFEILS